MNSPGIRYRYLLMPLIILTFFISFYLVYEDIKERTVNEFNNEKLILAKTASQGITSFFNDYQASLTFLSQLNDIINFNDDGKLLLSSYYKNHKNIFEGITRVDAAGIIVYTYPLNNSLTGSDISYQKHVQQIISTHKPVISDVFMSAQGYMAIALHVPIFDKNVYAGSLAMLIPIDKLGKQFLGNINMQGNGNAWLLSENEIELYCPLSGHKGNSYREIMQQDSTVVELLASIKMNNNGIAKSIHSEKGKLGKSVSDELYIAFYRAPLGNTYWSILISYHEKDIYESLSRLRNRLILIFSLLLIIISFYFYSLVKVRNILKEEAKRKKIEKTLQESEEKFRRIFEDHSAVKLLIDPYSHEIIDANKSAAGYYGWSREELKKMRIEEINTSTLEETTQGMNNVLSEKRNQFEFKHRLKNGSIRNVEVFSSNIKIGEKDILDSIIHDISERKQVEEALIEAKEHAEESDRLKTAFLQNMSHEIRTPMNAIMGFSSLMVEYFDNKPKLEQFSEIINLRCNDLLEIINDLLDISKIESGQYPVSSEDCNLNELFQELTEFFEEYRKRTNKQHVTLTLQVNCKPSDISIYTDKVKLRQILINLISNAFKFTNTGKIEGGCNFDSDQNLVFFVSDTGIGIPPDKHEIIFERFTQLLHDKNQAYGGTGLGLSIVKGLVGLLGGKIWLESEIDKGTSFYFSFPYQMAESNSKKQVLPVENQKYQFPDKTILVVEDDQFNSSYITEVLSNTGVKIINAAYGIKAVEIATTRLPDLILMDIRLPDISGYEAIRQIKLQDPSVKIIVQTAYASRDDKQKAFDAGCTDYISKPLNRLLLLGLLKKHLLK